MKEQVPGVFSDANQIIRTLMYLIALVKTKLLGKDWQSIPVVPQTRFSIFSKRTPEFCLGMWVLS